MTRLEALTPTSAQREAISEMTEKLWETGGALLAAEMGFGKSLLLVETAIALGAQTILISGPLHTRWSIYDHIMRQTNYSAPFNWINNTTKAGKLALDALRRGEAGFYFIGRELFRLTDWRGVKIDFVAHDECQQLARRTNKGYQAAFDLRSRTKYTVCSSATWYGSVFDGAYGIARILWPDIIERNYYRWVLQYCKQVRDPFAPNGQKVVGERNPGAFAASLPCYINPPMSDDLPPMIEDHYVDLTTKQRKLYDDFEAKGIVWLKEHPMIADVPIVQRIRLRQLTLGECNINDKGEVDFVPNGKSAKFDALKEMISDLPDEKILIATDSAKFARMVAARLGTDAFAWTGDKTGKERERAKGRFIKGDLKYIIATQAAIAEGTNGLQEVCHILIELSASDNPIMNQQLVGRLDRTGQTKRVLVYRIHGRDTIDDIQSPTLLAKEIEMRKSMLKEEAA